MQGNEISISVVYLSYTPFGTAGLYDFLRSYTSHPASYQHELVLLFKGMKNESELEPFIQVANSFGVPYQQYSYFGAGFDLDAYKYIATELHENYVLFFNSGSVILADDWLKKYVHCISDTVQVVAATASAQSHYSSVFINHSWKWDKNRALKYNFDKYKLFIKAFCYWKFLFPPFPNLHFRTNAFLINRALFISLNIPATRTKFDAFKIESGYNSITAQLKRRGVNMLLLDREGNGYTMQDWNKPAVFWKKMQEKLLVEDKQTRMYRDSPEKDKLQFQLLAWGKYE